MKTDQKQRFSEVAALKAAAARMEVASARLLACMDVLVRGQPTHAERVEMGATEKEYRSAQFAMNEATKGMRRVLAKASNK
jgi:hypothetical protein